MLVTMFLFVKCPPSFRVFEDAKKASSVSVCFERCL
ncbi:unnamed protein product [Arabidopsis lyrata]|nr:unnamed protein product [Arabidopsis lyrata]